MSWISSDLACFVSELESGSRPKGGASTDSGEISSLGGENILRSGGVILETIKKIPKKYYDRMTKGHLNDYDVLINKDGAQTGKVGLYRKSDDSLACINEHLFLIRGDNKKITQEFLYYTLLSQSIQIQIETQITGSAQPGLKRDFLNNIFLDIPTFLPEQSKIAKVFSTVDQAIVQTEKLIAKQQRIKTGLMQDILTRGIDKHGNIRSEKTHKFKDSPLGRIPEEWKVKEIDNCAYVTKLAGFEYTNYFDYSVGGEIIALRALNIKNERLNLSNIQRIPKSVSEKLLRSKIYADDILITYIGAYIGDVLRIRENDKYHLAPNIAKIVAGKSLTSEYLEYFLRSEILQRQIKSLIAVTATPSLTMTQIRKLFISIPYNIDEQNFISSRIKSINHLINKNIITHKKLILIKIGLMQDLLKGKVRVTPLLEKREVNA